MLLNMGPNTHSIPVTMFKDNRERVMSELKKHNDVRDNAYVLVQGGDNINLYNTDVEYVFRQVSFCLFELTGKTLLVISSGQVMFNEFSFVSFAADICLLIGR